MLQLPVFSQLLGLSVRLMVPRQRVGVALVGFNGKMEILMLRHVFHPAYPWGLPGGWLARGEDPAQGALRELQEETGLQAQLGPVVHIAHEPLPAHVGIAFSAQVCEGDLALSGEILEASWFPADMLPGPLQPFTERAIRAAVSQYPEYLITEGVS